MVDAMTILSAMALVGHMDALRYPAWHMVSSVVLINFLFPEVNTVSAWKLCVLVFVRMDMAVRIY